MLVVSNKYFSLLTMKRRQIFCFFALANNWTVFTVMFSSININKFFSLFSFTFAHIVSAIFIMFLRIWNDCFLTISFFDCVCVYCMNRTTFRWHEIDNNETGNIPEIHKIQNDSIFFIISYMFKRSLLLCGWKILVTFSFWKIYLLLLWKLLIPIKMWNKTHKWSFVLKSFET